MRDFQGQNIVNRNIADTLRSSHSERFAVLNNGVTIVARELRITGDKLFMKDYQVVNGGQTSHVLFNESDELTEAIHVPVKVISTDDEDLTTAVIQATNNQTAIKSEELNARADFERKLERFFETYGVAGRCLTSDARVNTRVIRRSRRPGSSPASSLSELLPRCFWTNLTELPVTSLRLWVSSERSSSIGTMRSSRTMRVPTGTTSSSFFGGTESSTLSSSLRGGSYSWPHGMLPSRVISRRSTLAKLQKSVTDSSASCQTTVGAAVVRTLRTSCDREY